MAEFEGVTHEFYGIGAGVDKAKDAAATAGQGRTLGFGKERSAPAIRGRTRRRPLAAAAGGRIRETRPRGIGPLG